MMTSSSSSPSALSARVVCITVAAVVRVVVAVMLVGTLYLDASVSADDYEGYGRAFERRTRREK